MSVIRGRLIPLSEDGTPGVIWAFRRDGRPAYQGVRHLRDDDYLTVYDDKGDVLWEGVIDLDFEALRMQVANDTQDGDPQRLGTEIVHGIQRNVPPSQWAQYFFDQRRAELRPAGHS